MACGVFDLVGGDLEVFQSYIGSPAMNRDGSWSAVQADAFASQLDLAHERARRQLGRRL